MPSGLYRGRNREGVKHVPDYEKPILWMILTAVISVIMTVVCFLTNPSLLYDFVQPVELNTSVNPYFVRYDTAFGNHVMSGMVYAEQWRNGICSRSAPVSLNQYVENIEIWVNLRKENDRYVGVGIQIDTDEYGGSLLTYFAFPDDFSARRWSFACYEEDEKVKVSSGEEKILAAIAFEEGSGIRVFDCETLVSSPEYLEEAEHMIVIRAFFDSQTVEAVGNEAALPDFTGN